MATVICRTVGLGEVSKSEPPLIDRASWRRCFGTSYEVINVNSIENFRLTSIDRDATSLTVPVTWTSKDWTESTSYQYEYGVVIRADVSGRLNLILDYNDMDLSVNLLKGRSYLLKFKMYLYSNSYGEIVEEIDLGDIYETSDGKTFARVGETYRYEPVLFEDIKPYNYVQTYTDNVELPCTRN